MRIATGTVIAGQIVLDDSKFIDGTHVVVVSRDREGEVHLSVEELAELEAGIAEADRGETIFGEALYDRLCRFG